jgi:hypothetical protein
VKLYPAKSRYEVDLSELPFVSSWGIFTHGAQIFRHRRDPGPGQ